MAWFIMTLQEALTSFTVNEIKPLARFFVDRLPTRKGDLIKANVEAMATQRTLRALWDELDEISRKAVSAAVYAGGRLDEAAFRA